MNKCSKRGGEGGEQEGGRRGPGEMEGEMGNNNLSVESMTRTTAFALA